MLQSPQPLAAHHLLEGFDCGRVELNDWLLRHARQAHASGSARTFVTAQQDGRVVGYYSLAVGQVEHEQATERIRKGMGRFPIPVVVLARLAASTMHQGQGIGAALLKNAIKRSLLISEHAGVRAILTHPIDAPAAGFYTHFEFDFSPLHRNQMLLLLKDARRFAM